MRPVKNGFAAALNLSIAACEPFFTGYAKLSIFYFFDWILAGSQAIRIEP
jgi:hypothetical protein